MTKILKLKINNLIINSELSQTDKKEFIELLDCMSLNALSSLYLPMVASPKKTKSLWRFLKAKFQMLKNISNCSFLTDSQKSQLKNIVAGMRQEEIDDFQQKIKNEKFDYFKKSNGLKDDLSAILKITKNIIINH